MAVTSKNVFFVNSERINQLIVITFEVNDSCFLISIELNLCHSTCLGVVTLDKLCR